MTVTFRTKIRYVRSITIALFVFMIFVLYLGWVNVPDNGIVSGYYGLDDDKMIISGITAGVSTRDFVGRMRSEHGLVMSDDVKTGAVLTNGFHSYALAVTGDVDGDGKVTDADAAGIEQIAAGNGEFSDAAIVAADVTGDGTVNADDVQQMKAALAGTGEIVGVKANTAANTENFCLVVKGKPQQMPGVEVKKRTRFSSDNEEVATIDENGVITGVSSGTAMITAKTGRNVQTALVTVVNRDVVVSLGRNEMMLKPNAQHEMKAYFSEPVSPKVTWTSSDPSVVSVSDTGVVTAVTNGSATIMARLENGSADSIKVDVVTAVESIAFAEDFCKIEPGKTRQFATALLPAETNEQIIYTSSDDSIATVENGVVTGVDYGTVTITATGKYSGVTDTCEVKVCDIKQVALTFDDGPYIYTEKLIDFLEENESHATFFMVGNLIRYQADTVKRMAATGNELGYHSYDHSYQTSLAISKVASDFQKTQNILYDITGQKATVWRAPGGYYNQEVLNAIPVPHIFWSVDTRDWVESNRNATTVKNAILSQAEDGAIILLHDLYESTVDGAIAAMEVLLEQDYELLTVTELLSRDGTPPKASVTYKSAK